MCPNMWHQNKAKCVRKNVSTLTHICSCSIHHVGRVSGRVIQSMSKSSINCSFTYRALFPAYALYSTMMELKFQCCNRRRHPINVPISWIPDLFFVPQASMSQKTKSVPHVLSMTENKRILTVQSVGASLRVHNNDRVILSV